MAPGKKNGPGMEWAGIGPNASRNGTPHRRTQRVVNQLGNSMTKLICRRKYLGTKEANAHNLQLWVHLMWRRSGTAERSAFLLCIGTGFARLAIRNVHFTTKLIAEPAATFAPGEGSCATIMEAAEGLVGISGPGVLSSAGAGLSDGGCAIATRPTENPAS